MKSNEQLHSLIETLHAFEPMLEKVEAAGAAIARSLADGKKLLTCGNGGSAADALHLSEELVGRFDQSRPAIPALCLAADSTLLTCIANDFGYDMLFARQIEAFGHAGDVLVLFSSSGDSANLVRGLEAARQREVVTIAILGKSGGKCRGLAMHEIIVPSQVTARIQEVHTFILHVWLTIIEHQLGFSTAGANISTEAR